MAQKSANKLSKIMSTAADSPMPAKVDKDWEARERVYRAEEDIRTLTRAKEIQADAARMRAVKQVATQQVKTLSSIAKRPGAK